MGETRTWLRLSWRTGLALALIVALAAFLRTYFSLSLWYPSGHFSNLGDYSGGSDPFYWERAMFYTLHTGKEISQDAAMNYPLGFPDVRPPLFNWFNLLVGYILSPLFGSVVDASVFMLMINAALMGTLTLIPTYLLGKEAFGKRTGLIAALLLAISAAALQRSHATIAVHDAWTLFFVVCAFYFYLRALKTLDRKRWVENWFSRASVTAGLRLFFRENRKPVLYSLLAGMSVAVTALSWQGWAYVPVILVLIFVVELLFDRIRNQDVMGVTILFALIIGTSLLVSFPWYYVRGLIKVWWDVPFYLFAVMLILGIVFSVTRDYPWTIVIPATFIAGGVALVVGFVVNPALLLAFYSGAGYFVKTKVYQTIAEAQEPGLSELFLSYGWFTYFIGLAAIGWMVWQMPRRNNAAFTMLVFWTVGSLFMAISAARFIFNASPPFAIATGWALDIILIRMDFAGMRRTYRSLAEGSRRNAFRKSVKVRHVLTILFLVFLVLLPNTWFAVDAAIPYESKGAYDAQINAMLPSFLRAPGYNPSSGTFYLGAFGYSLPKSTDYFPAGYDWLATQDTNTTLEQRPSLLSWWDYGFEVTERGGHPVVADPFQNGYAIAGQFILAQNESEGIALMTLRLIEGDYYHHGRAVGPEVSAVLTENGLSPAMFNSALTNQAALVPVILGNPKVYGLWDTNLQAYNAMYIYLQQAVLARLSEDRIVNLYHDIRAATGDDIAYFMVDSRLFPTSAQNTGIFYAPVKLSDHRVVQLQNGQVLPIDFFTILATTQNAQNIPLQDVRPSDTIQSETIHYQPMFYNSMFYRAYIGYSPTDLGLANDTGLPGFDQQLQAYPPQPAWNMTHFRVVYRTAYYNPYKDASNHTSAWRAVSYDKALELQKQVGAGTVPGVVDLSPQATVQNGLVMLRYYDGAYVNGTVTVGGAPVPHAWVTVTDEIGTPHGLTTTDANGRYSLLAPFGNITVTVSTGNRTHTTLLGANVLASATFPVTLDQAQRVNQDLNRDGVPDWKITQDFAVPSIPVHGTAYFDTNGDHTLSAGDLVLPGATVRIKSVDLPTSVNVTTNAAGEYTTPPLAQGTYNVSVAFHGHTLALPQLSVVTSYTAARDLSIPFRTIRGTVSDAAGQPLAGATVRATDATNGTSWSVVAGPDGSYNLTPLLSGAVTLVARSGVLGNLPLSVATASATQRQNLTLVPMGWATGSTAVMGVPQPHATLQFQADWDAALIVTVTSDASGRFNASLPAGRWNVNGRAYQGGQLYAYLAQVEVGAGASLALAPSFQTGVRVNGTATAATLSTDVRPMITFLGSSAQWWVLAEAGGAYVAYLPQASYRIQASAVSSRTGQAWAYAGSADLTDSKILNLPLGEARKLTGNVFWDQNGNGHQDAGEGILGARISLQDDLGRPLLEVTNETGDFLVIGFDNRTYSGTVSADGFVPATISSASLADLGATTFYALAPEPVAVGGRILLNGTVLLNRPVTVRAVPLAGTAKAVNATSRTDGTYSLDLLPGRYLLVVDENVSTTNASRYQNLGTDGVTLAVAQGAVTHDLDLAYRTLVRGNVTLNGIAGPATVNFTGPDDRGTSAFASGYRIYLQPGAYVVGAVRTVGSAEYAVLRNVTLPAAGNVSLSLAPAVQLQGQLLLGGQPLALSAPIVLVRAEGGSYTTDSSASGTYSLFVVPGNYTLSVAAAAAVPQGTYVRFYRYAGTGTVAVASGSGSRTVDLALARTLDNTTVSGTLTFGGTGADGTLAFLALDPGAINATVTVPSAGSFSVGLAPGAYSLYAVGALGRGASLGSLTVPHLPALQIGVALADAFRLSGVTTDASGARTSANVTVQGLATWHLATDSQGVYSLLLPTGSYEVSANRTGTEQGVPVVYAKAQQVQLTTDAVANLQLTKVTHRSVAIVWDSSQGRTIAAGASVTYTIVVRNTGNVADSYALSGQTSGWTFAFSPSIVSLNFGTVGNATAVSVTITSPANAPVAHEPATVVARSQGDTTVTTSLPLTVGILRTRSLSLTLDLATGIYDGRYLNYTVRVRNAGNAAESVDATVTNPSDLVASGWVPGLANTTQSAPGGYVLRGLSVAANSTLSVRLSLRNAGGASGVTVVLAAAAVDDPAVSAGTTTIVQLPALSVTTGIGVSGPSDVKSPPANFEFLAIVVGGAAGVAGALYVTRRRR